MTIPFNKARSQEFASQPTLARGKHALVITDVNTHTPKKEGNDNLMFRAAMRKIEDPSDGETIVGPTISAYITLPLDNPDVDGHEAPQWSGKMFASFAAAVNEEIPELPKYDRDSKETYFQGEVIAKGKDLDAARLLCINESGDYASDLWGEEGDGLDVLIGSIVYGEVTYEGDSDFPSLDDLHQDCPEDWELTDEIVEVLAPKEEEKPAKKKAKKKTKKKTTRKR